jgi:hypothetical protein
VLGWADAALVYAYDTGVVGPDVVADVARTHPELVVNEGARPKPRYLDPAVFNAECNDRTRRCEVSDTGAGLEALLSGACLPASTARGRDVVGPTATVGLHLTLPWRRPGCCLRSGRARYGPSGRARRSPWVRHSSFCLDNWSHRIRQRRYGCHRTVMPGRCQ